MIDGLKEMNLLLNKIHSMAERDHQELVDRGIDCQLKNCKHNYIYLDEKYHKRDIPSLHRDREQGRYRIES